MRFVVSSLFYALLFAGPGAFLQTESEEPWHVVRDPWFGRAQNCDSMCFRLSRTTYHVSRVLGGIAFAQQSSAELSLNAQLLAGARNGDEALVRRALEAGAAPNSRNRAGATVLMMFIRKGNAPIVDLLLAKGADVNLRNVDKVSPLMTAAYHGHAGIARALL